MAQSDDTELLVKIHAIAVINQEIYGQLPAGLENKPIFTIEKKIKSNKKEVNLAKTDKSVPVDLLQLCQPVQIQVIEDFFNDKLDYRVRNVSDLKRLNVSMYPIAKKYELFGPTPKAIDILQKFKGNYESIQVALGKIEEHANDRNLHRVSLEEIIAKFNERFQQIHKLTQKLEADIASLQQELKPPAVPIPAESSGEEEDE